MDLRSAKKGTEAQRITTPEQGGAGMTPLENEAPEAQVELYDGNPQLKSYMDFLEQHDVHKEDIMRVLETVMTTGAVGWGCKLFEKIPVTFRMRAAWVEDCISEQVDAANGKEGQMSVMRFSNLVRMANLAGSLETYGETKFRMDNEEDFKASLAFVQKLPYPILVKICDQLAIFDRAVAVALSDWALKNFTTPSEENS